VDTASLTTVYASVGGSGVFKSTDGGVTFPSSGNLFTSNNGSPTAPGYIRFAQSTRPDNSTLYVQAQLFADPASAGLFKSVDGGAHWSALYMATDGGATGITAANRIDLSKVHADQHALVFSPVSHFTGSPPTRVYNGTDGGLATTANPGPNANWTCLNGNSSCSAANGAIATVLFRQIDFGRGSADNNRYTYGVAQDLGVSSSQANCAGTPWLFGDGGDGNSVAVDPLNPQHALSAIGEGFTSTSDGGQSWTRGAGGLPSASQITYFDPNGKTAYVVANLNQLYQSKDNGANFTLINTFAVRVTAINMTALDSNTIWVGLIDGTIQRTAKALAGASSTWTGYTIPNGPQTQVWGLAVDPANTDELVVVYRSALGSAFHTADGGKTWARISDTLNSLPLTSVVIDPNTSPHTIIVATDTGVLSTRNLGVNWAPVGVGLPNVHCTSLALDASAFPSVVRVGTYGRSTFELAYQRVYVDWRNSTSTQDGTLSHPFRTVLQGVNALSNGEARYVNIEAGDYSEGPITYNQCGTLNALNGPVTIH